MQLLFICTADVAWVGKVSCVTAAYRFRDANTELVSVRGSATVPKDGAVSSVTKVRLVWSQHARHIN